MDIREYAQSFEQAKNIDLVDYLTLLGHEPSKVRSNDHWYYSPLRSERTPSFKVNKTLNRWYDHGIGKGGNIIDFAVEYFGCSPFEALSKLLNEASLQQPNLGRSEQHSFDQPEQKIKVIKELPLRRYSLCRYLRQRKIST